MITEPLRVYQGHEGWLIHVDWSPDGHWLASSSVQDGIKIWDATVEPESLTVG